MVRFFNDTATDGLATGGVAALVLAVGVSGYLIWHPPGQQGGSTVVRQRASVSAGKEHAARDIMRDDAKHSDPLATPKGADRSCVCGQRA